jgi:hypothetical protein
MGARERAEQCFVQQLFVQPPLKRLMKALFRPVRCGLSLRESPLTATKHEVVIWSVPRPCA